MKEFSEIAGSAHISERATIESHIHMGPRAQISAECHVGNFTFINTDSIVYPHVRLGRYCSIARNCEIGVANHPTNYLSTHSFQYHGALFPKLPIYKNNITGVGFRAHPETVIGSDVWLGAKSIIKSGVRIGDGVIVAANSVVTRNIPPYAIVGGSPAKLIRYRFEQIVNLLRLEWWNLPFEKIMKLPFDSIDDCIDALNLIEST